MKGDSMEIYEIFEKFKPLFNYEIKKFSSMGIPEDEIKSEINSLVLKVSRLNLDELSTGKYLKTSLENNLRKIIRKREKIASSETISRLKGKFNNLDIILEEVDSDILNNLEKFIYTLRRSGLKRREIAKILKRSESFVKYVLKNVKKKMIAYY